MKYPQLIRHNKQNFVARLINYKDRSIVIYKSTSAKRFSRLTTTGRIKLPFDWRVLERIWTSQDIFWEDKYDCKPVHGGAMLLI